LNGSEATISGMWSDSKVPWNEASGEVRFYTTSESKFSRLFAFDPAGSY